MKYYVTADIHGYYSIFLKALRESGFFEDSEPHKLIILGDLFDRGSEALELQSFVLQLMEEDRLILIKGNHEDLFEDMVTKDRGIAYRHHISNGTFDTALQLTAYDRVMAGLRNYDFADAAKQTPFYRQIIPSMQDYFETEHYVFVHGWIPGMDKPGAYEYDPDWRSAGPAAWAKARWMNGMDAVQNCGEEKAVLCGHWHASYGHARYEQKGSEFGADADFSPYYAPGIIALDACTAVSGKVNVIVLEEL